LTSPKSRRDLQPLSIELRDHLRLICGAEPTLPLTFDQSKIPLPYDFVKKVDAAFYKEVRKGAVPSKIIPGSGSREAAHEFFPPPPRKDLKYSWIPLSEIHTARTRIDSFVHLPRAERKRLHDEFATMVSCLMSQFDLIGEIDDLSITADQSAALTAAFSDALVEIQDYLFRPISRKHVLDKRGPLFRPKTSFDDRKIRSRNKQTLPDIVGHIRKRTSQIQNKGRKVVLAQHQINESENESILPPQYRTQPSDLTVSRTDFGELSARIRSVMESVEDENRMKRQVKPIEPPRHRPEIITTPRLQTEVVQPKPPKKKKSITITQFQHPENVFFDEGKFDLEPIEGVETGGCLDGIERLFAPLTPIPSEQQRHPSLDTSPQPTIEKRHQGPPLGDYIYEVSPDTIQAILDDEAILMVVNDKQAIQEHDNLTELWEQLGISAVTRLQMAAKLCSAVTEDDESDYHFQAIMRVTGTFKDYNQTYREYISALRLIPGIGTSAQAAYLAELTTNFLVAETAFRRANHELVAILGSEITTSNGTIAELLQTRAVKIHELRLLHKLDEDKPEEE
jgi:hypothetical protein